MIQKPLAILVASRWPWPVKTGHDRMLDQLVRHLLTEYHVHIMAMGREADLHLSAPLGVSEELLPQPSLPEIAGNVFMRRANTLQGCLYVSRSAMYKIDCAAQSSGASVVIFDMLRGAEFIEPFMQHSPATRVSFLCDLLSERYKAREASSGRVLGVFTKSFPVPVQAIANFLPGPLFRLESRLAERFEVETCENSDLTLLVSPQETDLLKSRAPEENIAVYAPSVVVSRSFAARYSEQRRFVFVGSPQYAPNAEALKVFDCAVADVRRQGYKIDAIAVGEPQPGFNLKQIDQIGYVEELDDIFDERAILVAPIQSGTGIKTKILDAMARSVPVITTGKGIEGLPVNDGREVFIANTHEELVRAIIAVVTDPLQATRVGHAGSRYAEASHEDRMVRTNFLSSIRSLCPIRRDVA